MDEHPKPTDEEFKAMRKLFKAELADEILAEAMDDILKMHELMMAQIPHGKCFYSAETIAAMNTAPGKARLALKFFRHANQFKLD